jgi:hypothetical protein
MAAATEKYFNVCLAVVQPVSCPAGLWSVSVMDRISDHDFREEFLNI